MARRRYESNFPWLSRWLKERKRKYVEQIMCLERLFFLVSHDMLALNLSFDGYFHVSKWHMKIRGADELSPYMYEV